jgi:hypothetical protein
VSIALALRATPQPPARFVLPNTGFGAVWSSGSRASFVLLVVAAIALTALAAGWRLRRRA